ncbi:MAG: hypothetical protein Q4E24_13340 [bacterium]|nr:hypothetical protein [bacterium]
MKIGLRKPKLDLSLKYIFFKEGNTEHAVIFHYSVLKGIHDVSFDSNTDIEIVDAYPSLRKVIRESASTILADLIVIFNKFVHNKKFHNRSI